MSEVKHTPLPWRVAVGNDPSDFVVEDSTHNTVCETNIAVYTDPSELDSGVRKISLEEAMGNAILVVTACNSHEELVTLLKQVDCPSIWFDLETHSCDFCHASNIGLIAHADHCLIAKVRAALAKAGRP